MEVDWQIHALTHSLTLSHSQDTHVTYTHHLPCIHHNIPIVRTGQQLQQRHQGGLLATAIFSLAHSLTHSSASQHFLPELTYYHCTTHNNIAQIVKKRRHRKYQLSTTPSPPHSTSKFADSTLLTCIIEKSLRVVNGRAVDIAAAHTHSGPHSSGCVMVVMVVVVVSVM